MPGESTEATDPEGGVKRTHAEGEDVSTDTATQNGGDASAQPRKRERKKKSGWDSAPPPGATPLLGAASVLTVDQLSRLERAKQYASTQMVQAPTLTPEVMATNLGMIALQTQQQMQEVQERAQRHRAMQIMCRIYVGSIPYEVDEKELEEVFKPFGSIKSVSMSKDHQTNKHKGFAFVEYDAPEGAVLAIEQMTGLGARGYKVGRPNNAPQAIALNEEIMKTALQIPRIYVSSINEELTEEQIKEVFESFGEIKACQLAYDLGSKTHKGYGYIEYVNQESAQEAVQHMSLFELGGHLLRVCRATTPEMPEFLGTAHGSRERALTGLPPPTAQGILGQPPPNLQPIKKEEKPQPQAVNQQQATALAQAVAAKAMEEAELEAFENQGKRLEEDDESVAISGSSQRFLLMQKLARKAGDRVIVLRDMVDADDVDDSLEDEVAEECAQFGKVEKVVVYQDRSFDEGETVKIFVQFEGSDEAQKAQKALDGRWFGGKKVVAELYDGARFAANDLTG